jgi:hypothetical protein
VKFTQLNLLPTLLPTPTKPPTQVAKPRRPLLPRRAKKIEDELQYLAFSDDYFWELLRKDYSSAWRYVDRMSRI